MRGWLIGVAVVLLGAVSLCARGEPAGRVIPLTASLSAGDVFAYESETVMTQRAQTPAGVAMERRDETIAVLLFRVIEADDDGAEVEMRYERFRMTVRGSGAAKSEMAFDSDESREGDAGNMLAAMLRPVVEAPVTLVVDGSMRVVEVRGLDGLTPAGGRAAITAESIISTVTPIFALRHEPGEAAVGASWESSASEKQRGYVLRRTSTKTVESVRGDEATLSLVDETELESGTMGAGVSIDSWQTNATVTWDAAQRRLISVDAVSEQIISGTQAGVPVRQSQTVKNRLTRVDAPEWPDEGGGASLVERDSERFDGVRAVMSGIVEASGVPALSVAVAGPGGVVCDEVVGVRVARGSSAVGVEEAFHIGSCTKAMTATLVGMAVEEGLLEWETTLGEALPEIAGEMHEQYKGVTIAQLVRHRAGVAAFTNGLAPENALCRGLEGDARAQRREFARRVLSIAPAHEAGEYVYSNGGYGIAAAIVERVMDASWEGLMRERLFGPLKMKTAGFGWPATVEHPDAPRGHYADPRFGDRPQSLSDSYVLPFALDPAGDVHCSSADLAKFARMHLIGLMGEDGLLKSETVKELHRPDGDYAAGWIVMERDGVRFSTHDGSAGTFYTRVTVLVDDGAAIVAQTNTGRGAEAVGEVSRELIGVVRAEE